ncbi:acyltransferase [Sphingomonas sp. AR_OL41]|uniref:acyltransferase family protein n=1 Tax=Sphingomonas sp. AR_OL41 TaxID=3042729 RepID=UPI0024816307|nr:acyltransferase [Sphingomonas sp. AR_OL41]MDH7970999.1 acyltransferase [Sphingomonas sp. AR_OL41]
MARTRAAGHFTDLDGMRGVLAVTVMLFHLGLNALVARLTHGLVPIGLWTLCVDFFLILSGFVLYLSLHRRRPDLKRYFIKRLRRLAPMFWIGTLAMLLLLAFNAPLRVVIANALIVQSIFKGLVPRLNFTSLDHPGWSVPFELFLPAMALPLLPAMARTNRRAATGLVAVLLALAATFTFALALRHDIALGRAAFGLGLGAALARLWQLRPTGESRPALAVSLFALVFAIMAFAGRIPALAILFPLISIGCVYFGARTRTFLSTRPFQAIGRWSYSIYLLHVPILTLVGQTLGSVAGSAWLKLLVVVTTIGIAALMYRFVEEPLMGGPERPAETAP